MELSEMLLLGGVVVETVVIIALLVKYHARGGLVCLEPRKDKLKVDYYWMSIKEIHKKSIENPEIINDPENYDFRPLFESEIIQTSEEFVYEVEGPVTLVSKERSIIQSFFNAIEYDPEHEIEIEDEALLTALQARTGTIKPPSGLRRPPGMAALVAIEINVVDREASFKR